MKIPVVRSDQRIALFTTAHEGDAGVDMVSSESHVIEPGESVIVGTGVSMAIPESASQTRTGPTGSELPVNIKVSSSFHNAVS